MCRQIKTKRLSNKSAKSANLLYFVLPLIVVLSLGVFTKTFAFILTNGLLMALNLFLFLCLFPIFTVVVVILFWKQNKFGRLTAFLIGSLISFVPFILMFIFPDTLMTFRFEISAFSVFIFIVTGLLTCGTNSSIGRAIYIYGVFAVCTISPTLLSNYLPYLYSPPSIQESNLPTLKEWIVYSKNNPGHGDFYCHYRNWISHQLSSKLSNDEKERLIKLRNRLFDIGFWEVRRADDMILFYKNADVILPPGPGVLYSLNGSNPNKSSNEYVIKAEPYEQVAGNWYMSRKLLLGGPRADVQTSIPEALIDKSLSLDDISPNELNIFSPSQEVQVSQGNAGDRK